MTDIDHSIEDLERQIVRSHRHSFWLTTLATAVAVVAIVGVTYYSIDGLIKKNIELGEKNDELTAQNIKLKKRSKELNREQRDYESVKLVFSKLLAKLSEVDGVDDPNYQTNKEELVDSANARIAKLNQQLEGSKVDRPIQIGGYTESEKEAIRKAIKVEQTATKSNPPKGRGDDGRTWYKIAYTVTMDPLVKPVKHERKEYKNNQIIERVEYRFNERWYNPSRRQGRNRSENFGYSILVWGVTAVNVAIFVKGFDMPIIRQGLMSLNKTSIF